MPSCDVLAWARKQESVVGYKLVLDPIPSKRDVPQAYEALFDKGAFSYLGKVRRSPGYKQVSGYDEHFRAYLDEFGAMLPHGYLFAAANVEAELPSVMKYSKPVKPVVNEDAWKFARMAMYAHYYPVMCGSNEVSAETVWPELNHQSSNGWPWSCKWKDKTDFIADGGMAICEMYYEGLLDGTSWTPVWTNSVKQEMRPFDRVLINKLRTFCASPIEHCMALARVCHDMNSKFYRAGARGRQGWWSSVGMTKFYRGWNKLANRLTRGGKFSKGISLDVSEYDSSMHFNLFLEVQNLRKSCLTSEDAKRRLERLYHEIVWSTMVLTNGMLVEKSTGNPSGSENTVVDNTIGLFFLLAYSFARCYQETHEQATPDVLYMMENVEAALYGDDDTFFVSDEVSQWLSPERLAYYGAEMGFKITSESNDWRWISIEQASFLSHGFRFDEKYSMFLPIPDPQKILCSQLYGDNTKDVRWSLLRAEALLIEGFWTPARDVLRGYIEYLYQQRGEELHAGEIQKGVTMSVVRSNLRSDEDIIALYCGRLEGLVAPCWSWTREQPQL